MPRPASALLVDDEAHVLLMLRKVVTQLGVKTLWEVSSGAEAIAAAEAHKPDVVLLDLNMPSMNGLEVLQKLKAANPKLPVIIVSAQDTMRTLNKAKELGALGYVVKHAPLSELQKSLSGLFDAVERGFKNATEAPKAEGS